MSKPLWLIEAQRHIGVKEIKGAKHNSFIILWLKTLSAWWWMMKLLGAALLSRTALKNPNAHCQNIGCVLKAGLIGVKNYQSHAWAVSSFLNAKAAVTLVLLLAKMLKVI